MSVSKLIGVIGWAIAAVGVVVFPGGPVYALEYPYAPYNEGRMDPQLTGWPLTQAEIDFVAKATYERRPGAESGRHLPAMWPVTPMADGSGNPNWFVASHSQLVTVVKQYVAGHGPDVDILLVGDSITAQWCGMAAYSSYPQPFNAAWKSRFPNYKAVNIGIGGDKTQGILWRLDHGGITGLNPRLVIMAIGHNNMYFSPETGIEAAAQGILWCVKNIREKCPNAEVLVVKIFPNNVPTAAFYRDARAINTALDALNLESDPKVHVLPDTWNDMINTDGTIRANLFDANDKVHLTQVDGYGLYADKLKPVVERLLATRTTYYVATDGNDGNDGKSLQTPFRRIQKAADVMLPGDTCLIRGGEYREKIVPPRGGTSDTVRITYRNYGNETPVIKGSERVTGWVDQGGGVWKAVLPQSLFASAPYNPFLTKAGGLWIVNPDNKWSLGMVYLDGTPLGERTSLAEVQAASGTWFAVRDGTTTVVQARFDRDPNTAVAEVNVRDACFHPGTNNILHFISISGLTMKQAAPNGSGPIHPQQGIITVFAGRGWVIERCSISDSPCCGIALATGPDSWYNEQSATVNGNATVPDFNASGFHLVRGNTIERCGQAGIIGMINGHSSIIEKNLIQDINCEFKLGGAETAGIKLHWAIDVLIRNNIIRRVYNAAQAGQNFGLWLDFANQGARVSGNVIYDIIDQTRTSAKTFPLYLEANVGPIVVDNNILIKHPTAPYNNELGSLHSVMAHNLVIEGRLMQFNDPSRGVPYYQPHSLRFVAKLDASAASNVVNHRYINRNNIYIGQYSDQEGATATGGNVKFDWGNAQEKLAFSCADTPNGVAVRFAITDEAAPRLVNSDLVSSAGIGDFPLVNQRVSDRDGNPYDIDVDLFGRARDRQAGSLVPGPFATLVRGTNAFVILAGVSALSNSVSTVNLRVAGGRGVPSPAAGAWTCVSNSVVQCSMAGSPAASGGTQYVCTGWVGTGSVTNGIGTNASFNIRADSTLTWIWRTNYWISLNSK